MTSDPLDPWSARTFHTSALVWLLNLRLENVRLVRPGGMSAGAWTQPHGSGHLGLGAEPSLSALAPLCIATQPAQDAVGENGGSRWVTQTPQNVTGSLRG